MGNVTTHPSIRLLPKKFGPKGYEIRTLDRYSDEEFMEFCAENPDLRIEMDKTGKLIIIPPVDTDGGLAESHAHGLLYSWWLQYKQGHTFSPTTGFKLPDGSTRSADGAWLPMKNWLSFRRSNEKICPARSRFRHRNPLRKRSNRPVKKKNDGYLACQRRPARMADRPESAESIRLSPRPTGGGTRGFDRSLSGEDVCPGFELDLRKLL